VGDKDERVGVSEGQWSGVDVGIDDNLDMGVDEDVGLVGVYCIYIGFGVGGYLESGFYVWTTLGNGI
jgi:hypothetical protein